MTLAQVRSLDECMARDDAASEALFVSAITTALGSFTEQGAKAASERIRQLEARSRGQTAGYTEKAPPPDAIAL